MDPNADDAAPPPDARASASPEAFRDRIAGASETLPATTVFTLATAGLRVRMTRSMVTTASVVLAIAFLSYSGLTNLLTRNLAGRLGEMEREVARDDAAVGGAVDALLAADLFSPMSLGEQRRLAASLDMTRIQEEELEFLRIHELVRTSRVELAQAREDLMERRKTLADLGAGDDERDRIEEALPRFTARIATLEKRLQEAAPREANLLGIIQLGRWVEGDAKETANDDAMRAMLIEALESRKAHLLGHAAAPSSLGDRALAHLELLLTLAHDRGHMQSASVARAIWDQEQRRREAASLRQRMRRAGVDPQRAIEGDPLDTWLIVMALLTCAVGIANAMLMSVTERIREIGTMKCLGAEDGLVIRLFLIESALVGSVGALVGIALGVLVALAAGIAQFGAPGAGAFPLVQAWPVVAWSIAAGFFLSVAGALGPAYQAAHMRPVDALRVDE